MTRSSARKLPANVYLIETPLQLLNAIEAKNYFKLLNNHLIVRLEDNIYPEIFKRLIDENDWEDVRYITFRNKTMSVESRFPGQWIAKKIRGFRYDYQQYLNRKDLDSIIVSIGRAENIFLGNYMRKLYDVRYMYHFANMLKHDNLYILDDGTDVIQIGSERKNRCVSSEPPKACSGISRLKTKLREVLVDWNDKESDMVTFFSAYDIEVGSLDSLIRNEYQYFRDIASRIKPSEDIFFLGEWLVEDGYMEEDYYLEYLSKVKKYFSNNNFYYIPHPRESVKMVNRIKESLGIEIRRFGVPIEYEISIRGNMPKVLASFFSSALQNCQMILDKKVKIKAFYIEPEHLMRAPELAQKIYEHFEKNANENFEVIRL